MTLSPADVEDIVAILDSTAYVELTLRTPRFALTLRRRAGGWTQEAVPLAEPRLVDAPGARTDSPASPSAAEVPTTDEDPSQTGLHAVRSPIVGTFYRAPKPGADPFVEVGDPVTVDTVVGIMETMKLMTSVAAGLAGRVARIGVADAEFAEAGTTLMWIEPT